MTAETAIFDLPPVMKLEDCEQLFSFFEQSAGTPVTIRCEAVSRLTGLAAQTLCFAAEKWAQDDLPFCMENLSDGCMESLNTLGLGGKLIPQELPA